MNQILILFMASLIGSFNPTKVTPTEETVSLTINYEVLNTVKGYSYISRLDVYVDGKKVGASSEIDQQTPNSVTVAVPKGNHDVRAVMLAKYDNNWEERTVANSYSIDFVWTKNLNFSKKSTKVKLYFDIDSGVHENKKPKKVKKK